MRQWPMRLAGIGAAVTMGISTLACGPPQAEAPGQQPPAESEVDGVPQFEFDPTWLSD